MNKYKIKKEKDNLKLLKVYFQNYGFSLYFWTLLDGMVRRLHLGIFYKYTHKKRYNICKKYLLKKYSYVIDNFKTIIDNNPKVNKILWVFWWQGEDQIPYPVDLCIKSIKNNNSDNELILISKNNINEYLEIPQYIIEKVNSGAISITHLSDYIRVNLLNCYGGVWLDSTFFMTKSLAPEIFDMKFYSINHGNKRKWVISKDLWSVSLLTSSKDSPIMKYLSYFQDEYWKNEKVAICYLLLDCMIAIGYEKIGWIKELIDEIPENNINNFSFLHKNRNKIYNEKRFIEMTKNTYIFKLTYKESYQISYKGKDTNFGKLIKESLK